MLSTIPEIAVMSDALVQQSEENLQAYEALKSFFVLEQSICHLKTNVPMEAVAKYLDQNLSCLWPKMTPDVKEGNQIFLINTITSQYKTPTFPHMCNCISHIAIYDWPQWHDFTPNHLPHDVNQPLLPIEVSFAVFCTFVKVIDSSPNISHIYRQQLKNYVLMCKDIILNQIKVFPEITIPLLFRSLSFFKWCNSFIVENFLDALWDSIFNFAIPNDILKFVYIVFIKRKERKFYVNYGNRLIYILSQKSCSLLPERDNLLSKITMKYFKMIINENIQTLHPSNNGSTMNTLIQMLLNIPLTKTFWMFWTKIAKFILNRIENKVYHEQDIAFLNTFKYQIYDAFNNKFWNEFGFLLQDARQCIMYWQRLFEYSNIYIYIQETEIRFISLFCPLIIGIQQIFDNAINYVFEPNASEQNIAYILHLVIFDISIVNNKPIEFMFQIYFQRQQILPCYFTFLSQLRDNFPQCEQYWDQIFKYLIVPALRMNIPILSSEAILLSSHFNISLGYIDFLMDKCVSFLHNYDAFENINIIKAIERFINQTNGEILKKYGLDIIYILIGSIKIRNYIPKVIMKYNWKLLMQIFHYNELIQPIPFPVWMRIFDTQNEYQIGAYFHKFMKRVNETLQSQQKEEFKNAIKDIIAVICYDFIPENYLFGFDDDD